MGELFVQRCLRCQSDVGEGYFPRCPSCDGAVEVFYAKAPRIRDAETHPLHRYREFLPIVDPSAATWIARTEPSPCIHAQTLGDAIGHKHVYIKNETTHPTGTTKDRMASVALTFLRERGVREFVTSSTGNSSTSFAHAVATDPSMRIHLFCGEAFLHAMNWPAFDNVELYVAVNATFVEAYALSQTFAKQHGFVSERGFFNPGRRAGLALAFAEAAEQVRRPIDWYVQAVSSGMGVIGTQKMAVELTEAGVIPKPPKALCAQQATCAPMANAWARGETTMPKDLIIDEPRGVARAILRGDPSQAYPYMQETVHRHGGTFVAVPEADILHWQRQVAELEGIECCAAAACAVGSLAIAVRDGTVAADEVVVINLTGSDRPKGPPPPHHLVTP